MKYRVDEYMTVQQVIDDLKTRDPDALFMVDFTPDRAKKHFRVELKTKHIDDITDTVGDEDGCSLVNVVYMEVW